MKLETKIRQILNEANYPADSRFEVIAFELWGNASEGFECNKAWKIAWNASLDVVLESVRERWGIFKYNYLPKARVSDIQDTGFDSTISLEVECVPFLEIRLAV